MDSLPTESLGNPPMDTPQCIYPATYWRTFWLLQGEFLLFHILPSFDIVHVLSFCHFHRCIVVSHYTFNFHFRNTNDVEHVFICLFSAHTSLVLYLFKSFPPLPLISLLPWLLFLPLFFYIVVSCLSNTSLLAYSFVVLSPTWLNCILSSRSHMMEI